MNKEQRILRERTLQEAALNCFAIDKWEDVSVARIAKLAGVAKGTVYLHFASKEEICASLAQEFYDELQRKYHKITGTGCEQLKQLIEISFSHFRERENYRHVVQYCQREHFFINLDPALTDTLQNSEQYRHKRIADALNQGMQDKTLLPDAEKNLTGICCALNGALASFSREQLGQNTDQNTKENAAERTNAEQQSQKEFINRITSFILSGVENRTEPKATGNSALPAPELTLEVQ